MCCLWAQGVSAACFPCSGTGIYDASAQMVFFFLLPVCSPVLCMSPFFLLRALMIVVILVHIKNACLCFHKAEIGSCHMQSCFGVAHFYLFDFCSAF